MNVIFNNITPFLHRSFYMKMENLKKPLTGSKWESNFITIPPLSLIPPPDAAFELRKKSNLNNQMAAFVLRKKAHRYT